MTTTNPTSVTPMPFHEALQVYKSSLNTAQPNAAEQPGQIDPSAAGRALAQARQAKRNAAAEQQQPVADAQDEQAESEQLETDSQETEQQDETAQDAQPEDAEQGDDPLIEIDGEQIPLSQIRKERMLHSDYTKKTQATAAERKLLDEQRKTFEGLQKGLTDKITTADTLIAALQAEIGTPTIEQLKAIQRADPANFPAFQLELADRMQKLNTAVAYRQQLATEQTNQQRERTLTELAADRAEWRDPATRSADLGKIRDFAKQFLPSEVVDLIDTHPGYIKLAEMAMKQADFQKRTAGTPKRLQSLPRVVRPGAKPSQTSPAFQAIATAQAAFDKTPTLENAKALMLAKEAAGARKSA